MFKKIISIMCAMFLISVFEASSAVAADSGEDSSIKQQIVEDGITVADPEALNLPVEKVTADGSPQMQWSKTSTCTAAWGTRPTCKANYGTWGAPGLKIYYQWGLRWFSHGEAAVSGRGYNAKGQERWYGLQAGQHGSGKVPWGNVLSIKAVKVKPMRFGVGSSIWWQ
ncbi:hypothetical protein [uncultured Varibaculum sp.]|uniref:hypothetical protein n=1 Tax=uncultured Varibaculum sp. TaxID=413896 RepID=UPI002595826F|nr:hypothetical protein [uncultured Varibaculum sp.]